MKQSESDQAEDAEERRSPSSQVVHEAILREGEEELERSASALGFSGFAAGLSMGASLITEAAMKAHLPDAQWTPLVSKLGYSVGFLIVILGRQQLFTENTLTPILPLLSQKSSGTILKVLRLWLIVLSANLIGAALIAFALAKAPICNEEIRQAIYTISLKTIEPGFGSILCRGIFAGWLIALLVWVLPFSEAARFWVIIAITYVIGIAEFSHVIAGSVEVFALYWSDRLSWAGVFTRFLFPALLGNILGGVTLVACVNHAQVKADK